MTNARALALRGCAALALLLPLTATTVALPAPAAAQSLSAQPDRTVFGVRILGAWVDDDKYRWNFVQGDSTSSIKMVVTRPSTGEQIARAELKPGRHGLMGDVFTPLSSDPHTQMRLYVEKGGEAVIFFDPQAFLGIKRSLRLKRPAGIAEGNGAALWAGRWRTTRGVLDIGSEAAHLFGFTYRGEPLAEGERLALKPDGGHVMGAWERGGEWSATVPRGDVYLRLSADEKRFTGYFTDVTTGAKVDWTGEREDRDPGFCGSAYKDFEKAGRLYSKLRWQNGREVNGRVEYYASLALFHLGEKAVTLTPANATIRVEGLNGRGTTATMYWFDNGSTREEIPDLRPISKCQNAFPTFRFVDLPKEQAKRAVLIVDGQRTLSWELTGIEVVAEPQPPSSPQQQPAPVGTPPQPPAPPTQDGAFKSLNRIDVRVDRVVVARGYPTHQVHAFVTVKNASATPQYFTSGFMKVFLADADGAGWERSQPYRASGEPAELFMATPVIRPGGELKVRYVFTPEVDARLTSLTLTEGGKTAEFPVGAL